MMSEYLWDKTGEDTEIEGLENTLSVLRYQPTAPPAPPLAISVTVAKPSWWKFSLAFALPACLLAAVVIGVWLTRQGTKLQTVDQSIAKLEPPMVTAYDTRGAAPKVEKKTTPQILKTIFTPERARRSRNVIHTKFRKRQPTFETLTSEELYAYNQVKLALSITSSKLKVVSDTINRAED